jgi:transcriptional regulator with XRE-family HTH domain
MSDINFLSISDVQARLGEQVRQLRISKDLSQISAAEKAGISERAMKDLEAGRGSTVETLLRVLKALDSLAGIDLIVPKPTVSPLAVLRHAKPRQRVRRSGKDRSLEKGSPERGSSKQGESEQGAQTS